MTHKNRVRFVESLDDLKQQDEETKKPDKGETQRKFFESRKKNPNACVTCRGEGATFADPNDDKEDLEVDNLICPACLGRGHCPRCAVKFGKGWHEKLEKFIEDGGKPLKCSECGWKDGDPAVLTEQPFDSGRKK